MNAQELRAQVFFHLLQTREATTPINELLGQCEQVVNYIQGRDSAKRESE